MSYSGLTAWQIVRQSAACHPDWNVETHLAYLVNEEGVDLDALGNTFGDGPETAADVVERWLEEFDRLPPLGL